MSSDDPFNFVDPDQSPRLGSPEPRALRAPSTGVPANGGQVPWPSFETPRREDGIEIGLMDYLSMVWARRWLVLGVATVVIISSSVWGLTRPKLYRAHAEISVGQRTPQIIRNQIDMGPSWWELERYVEEQTRVLGSRKLAAMVADRIARGESGIKEATRTLAVLGPDPTLQNDTATEATSDDVEPALQPRRPNTFDRLVDRIRGMLDVERLGETNIVQLSMVSENPDRAAEWLNLYVDSYILLNIDDNLQRTRKVNEVIQKRLDPMREAVARSERDLMEFKEREDAILFADQDKNVITEQVSTLTSEYAKAKAERIRLETRINALGRIDSPNLSDTTLPEVLNDRTVQGLMSQRNALQVELGEKLGVYREGHPAIKELRSRLAGIDEQLTLQISTIASALQTDFSIARSREQSLFDNIQQLKEQSIELSKQTMEYERLKRDYEQNKSFLETMLERSREVDISETAVSNNVRIIEHAVAPGAPFSPNLRRILLVAVLFGLALGVGLVFGLDFLDQTLRTPEEVERFVGHEVLAVLPRIKEEKPAMAREAFQALRTALMLASRSEGCQVAMITSAVPSEGKTTVAVELARVLAINGSRVLLIDADLRRARLHRVFQVSNSRGLTSLVLGESPLGDVVNRSPDIDNLEFITSGPLPPNPPELFGKPSFKRFLDEARRTYDWVIIDTPPVASVTDPVVCSRMVDTVLLVIQFGGAKRQTVRDAVRLLGRAGVNLAGAVLNKVDLEQSHYYYYYYSHYSYYQYGYGDQHEG